MRRNRRDSLSKGKPSEMPNSRQLSAEGYTLSQHAEVRAQQRGIPRKVIGLIVAEADIRLHAGLGCDSIRISRRKMANLRRAGIEAALIERVSEVVLVIDPASDFVVTAFHDTGPRGRRYRRQHNTRSGKGPQRNPPSVQMSVLQHADCRHADASTLSTLRPMPAHEGGTISCAANRISLFPNERNQHA